MSAGEFYLLLEFDLCVMYADREGGGERGGRNFCWKAAREGTGYRIEGEAGGTIELFLLLSLNCFTADLGGGADSHLVAGVWDLQKKGFVDGEDLVDFYYLGRERER